MDWMVNLITFFSEWVQAICVWLADLVLTLGYPGIVALMAIESSLIPFPSELVMPPAGYLIHEGQFSWILTIGSGILGSLLGALFNYYLALHLGRPFLERYGKYVFIKPAHLERAEKYFARHGEITTFIGRLIPVIRQLISLPAGAAKMRLDLFCLYTTLGAGIWTTLLTVVGWLVGKNRHMVQLYMKDATVWVLAGCAVIVFVYVKITRRRAAAHAAQAAAEAAPAQEPEQKNE